MEPLEYSFGPDSSKYTLIFSSLDGVLGHQVHRCRSRPEKVLPRGGKAAKRDRLSEVSYGGRQSSEPRGVPTAKLARHDVRGEQPHRLPLSAILAFSIASRQSGHILVVVHSVESCATTKTAHHSGQGPTRPPEEHNSATSDRYWGPWRPSGLSACERAASRIISQDPHESPSNPCENRPHHPATTSINTESTPRRLVLAASRIVARSGVVLGRSGAVIVPENQPHPCSSLCPFTAWTPQCCFDMQNLDTEDNRKQSEIVKGPSWWPGSVSSM